MNAQEKRIQIISEIANSNLSDELKLKLIQEAAQEAAQTVETAQTVKKPRKAVQTVKRDGRPTKNDITLSFLTTGSTFNEIVNGILEVYPESDRGTIEKTTARRLNSYLKNEFGIEVKKSSGDDPLYFLGDHNIENQ